MLKWVTSEYWYLSRIITAKGLEMSELSDWEKI